MTSGIPGFCMQAAMVAIEHQPGESARMRTVFAERAKLVHELLSAIPRFQCVPPTGAFYAFPDVSACFGLSSQGGKPIENAGGFAEALLEAVGVAVVPGDDFGEIARNHVRISFASDEATIREGLGRITKWVASLEG